jgi:hypothetical protein
MRLESQSISFSAYQLWAGETTARDQAHWFEAERQLKETAARVPDRESIG